MKKAKIVLFLVIFELGLSQSIYRREHLESADGPSFNVPCPDQRCLTCEKQIPSICLLCKSPFFLEQADCVTICEHGYPDRIARVCTRCDVDHCDSCLKSPNKCTKCDEGFEPDQSGQCIPEVEATVERGDESEGAKQGSMSGPYPTGKFKKGPPNNSKNESHAYLIFIPITVGILALIIILFCLYKRKKDKKKKSYELPNRAQNQAQNEGRPAELRAEDIAPSRNNPVRISIDAQLNADTINTVANSAEPTPSKQILKSGVFKYAPNEDDLNQNNLNSSPKVPNDITVSNDSPNRMLVSSKSNKSSAHDSQDKDDESGICLICQDKKVNMVFLDCMHICTCEPCSKLIIDAKAPCPFCREDIKSAKKVFIA